MITIAHLMIDDCTSPSLTQLATNHSITGGAGVGSQATVKSNHHLTELLKMTFRKRDPELITLFFASPGSEHSLALFVSLPASSFLLFLCFPPLLFILSLPLLFFLYLNPPW